MKLQLQSEMGSLELGTFMRKHRFTDPVYGLSKMVDHIYALAPQHPHGFEDDHYNTR